MLHLEGSIGMFNQWLPTLAQMISPEQEIEAAENTAFIFNGPQFFIALIAGVILAFAFQLLLTNLGVAAGISLAGRGSKHHDSHHDSHKSSSLGSTIRKIGFAVGLGTLVSVTISLFVACLLAVKLTLLISPGLGAIVGLVIWGTYFTLLVLISSTTVGSLIGSVVNTATSGFQALFGTAAAAIGGNAASNKMVATAEAAAAAVRNEFMDAVDPVGIREQFEDYVRTLRSPEIDMRGIRDEFERIVAESNLNELAEGDRLPNIDRQVFVDLIRSRTDLSSREVDYIADQLETSWQQAVRRQQSSGSLASMMDYVKMATSDQLTSKEFGQKIDDLISEMRRRRKAEAGSGGSGGGIGSSLSNTLNMGLNSLIGMVIGRTDLSDFDVERVVNQLKKLSSQASSQAGSLSQQLTGDANPPYSAIRADVENYLLNTYSWLMTPQRVSQEFREVIYDPNANPEIVANELEQLSRSDFVDLLQQRGVFTQDEIQALANQLNVIRLEALNSAREAVERERRIHLLSDVERYLLRTPLSEFTPEKIQLAMQSLASDPDADYDQLHNRLYILDRPYFERILSQRADLTPTEIGFIVIQLEQARDHILQQSQENHSTAKAKAEEQWLKLKSYLRDTGKGELNPQAIEQDLRLMLHDPQAGFKALRTRASYFDRDTLVQLLSQRDDISETQANEIIDRVERTWTRVRYGPQQIAGTAKTQYDQTMAAIAQYLRDTDKDELNPDGIQQDLSLLLENPQLGIKAIQARLSEVDRDTLVKLLSQREDLTEEQVNEVIDNVLSTLRRVANAPRRLALRSQAKVQDFQMSVADYLRSTGKEELQPDGIRRDVNLLLHDPRAGVESLRDRLSQFDRSTFVALLSQREDISEEEANRIADQIVSVRDEAMARIRSVQYRVRNAIQGILDRIRYYLNSLERPELNYDGIKRDVRLLFNDPRAGFDALRMRLGQFDRDTLVAVLSSNNNISERDANHIVDQIESARNSVLHQAERLQHEAQTRAEDLKRQAQHQLDETRKAAAAASWWLFFTAVISALASAGAGALGVVD